MKYFSLLAVACAAALGLSLYLFSRQPTTVVELADAKGVATAPAMSANWTLDTTIGSIVAARPETSRVLELVGIDYCCGGDTPLRLAAAEQGVDETQLLNALLSVGATANDGMQRDWQQETISDLLDHIVETHHTWLRRELPLLAETAQTVLEVHGEQHPELARVIDTINEVRAGIMPHLDDEEQNVFPALRQLEAGTYSGEIALQLEEMRTDHDSIGVALKRLRKLTNGYHVPANGCAKYREMMSGLDALEKDLHLHVHLENNVVLPRAMALLEK